MYAAHCIGPDPSCNLLQLGETHVCNLLQLGQDACMQVTALGKMHECNLRQLGKTITKDHLCYCSVPFILHVAPQIPVLLVLGVACMHTMAAPTHAEEEEEEEEEEGGGEEEGQEEGFHKLLPANKTDHCMYMKRTHAPIHFLYDIHMSCLITGNRRR